MRWKQLWLRSRVCSSLICFSFSFSTETADFEAKSDTNKSSGSKRTSENWELVEVKALSGVRKCRSRGINLIYCLKLICAALKGITRLLTPSFAALCEVVSSCESWRVSFVQTIHKLCPEGHNVASWEYERAAPRQTSCDRARFYPNTCPPDTVYFSVASFSLQSCRLIYATNFPEIQLPEHLIQFWRTVMKTFI